MERVSKDGKDFTVLVVIEVTLGVQEKKNLVDDTIGSNCG